jgi:Fe-S cluster biogenesis protein NfuA
LPGTGLRTGKDTEKALLTLMADNGTDVLERIEQTLDTLRPYIASHRGQVEIVDFDEGEGTLLLRLGGTCHGCSASTITLRQGIEARLRQMVPEVKQVEAI